MKFQVISFNKKRTAAQVVRIENNTSVTRHVVLEGDGKYHWRKFQTVETTDGPQLQPVIDETYTLV